MDAAGPDPPTSDGEGGGTPPDWVDPAAQPPSVSSDAGDPTNSDGPPLNHGGERRDRSPVMGPLAQLNYSSVGVGPDDVMSWITPPGSRFSGGEGSTPGPTS